MPKNRLAHSGFDRLRQSINAKFIPPIASFHKNKTKKQKKNNSKNNLESFTYATAICNIVYR